MAQKFDTDEPNSFFQPHKRHLLVLYSHSPAARSLAYLRELLYGLTMGSIQSFFRERMDNNVRQKEAWDLNQGKRNKPS